MNKVTPENAFVGARVKIISSWPSNVCDGGTGTITLIEATKWDENRVRANVLLDKPVRIIDQWWVGLNDEDILIFEEE